MKRYFQPVEKSSAKRQREVNERNENAPGNTNEETDVNVTDVKGKTYKYNADWEKAFLWLKFDATKQMLFCTYCQAAPPKIKKDNPYVLGNKILKKDNVQKHSSSHRHMQARDAFLAKQNPERPGTVRHSIVTGIAKSDNASFEEVR